ncbi:MAG: hypothetical protein LBU18_00280, partial [Treponema sp.]|nr:hypothetical protein [Treponema sp.]
MKREVSAVFNGKRPLRTRAALTALALFLIWGGGGCQNVNISSAADPALTGTVSITGEAQVGAALTASLQAAGTRTVSYQWESGESAAGEFAPIEGANDKTYTVTADDLGKYIRVTVTREGYKGGLSSAAKGPVVTLLTGTVGITGEVKVGETLTASLENEADGAFTYQWLLGGSEGGDFEPIEGAAGETYLIAPEDADKYIKVNVTREGYAGGLSSEVLGPIAPLPPLTASVSISGLRKAGAELTANFTQLEGAGTISFRWRISGSPDGDYADIEGATGETYTPVNVDVGKYIKVVVTREGYSSSVESAAKGPLLAANTTAESVEITGDDAIYRGEEESRQYTAAVNGSNPPQEIIWSIVESPASAGTFITQEGCLTVAFGETLPSITVRAASAFDETASVEKSVSIKELYWTAPANTTGINGINAIAFGNGVSAGGEGAAAKFVAGGVGGKAAYSTDGVSWTAVSDTKFGGAEITAICYGGEDANARFVAGGAGGKAAYSTDGV